MSLPDTYLHMVSALNADGALQMKLVEKPMPTPGDDEVVIQIEAAPINPSDQGVMFGWASMQHASSTGDGAERVFQAQVPPQGLRQMSAVIGKEIPLGNEGCGTVVAAGKAAQGLMGRRVGIMGGGTYGQYRKAKAAMCLPLSDSHTARDGAACFVNPMTALSMLETMRLEGHSALVHTAAASNLGQMLLRLCQADGVPLVNVVRSAAQVAMLREMGATHVVDSSSETFHADLIAAIEDTGATLVFDATGGGRLASDILTAMEAVEARKPESTYSIYGTARLKQAYLYGALTPSETVLTRGYGWSWSVGAWLLPNFLNRVGMEGTMKMQARVLKDLTTIFANPYTDEISLSEALDAQVVARYHAKRTGEKFLINPQLPL